jgi:hypothetical protein
LWPENGCRQQIPSIRLDVDCENYIVVAVVEKTTRLQADFFSIQEIQVAMISRENDRIQQGKNKRNDCHLVRSDTARPDFIRKRKTRRVSSIIQNLFAVCPSTAPTRDWMNHKSQ